MDDIDELEEVQGALETLTPDGRAYIAAWLRDEFDLPDSPVGEPPPPPYAQRKSMRMSVEEYLDLEDATGQKYEYVAGQIFAMSGATARHGAIVQNLSRAFGNHLEGGPCRVFASETKVHVKVNADDVFYIPDVMVVCGQIDMESRCLTEPKLVVEVISPSTKRTDRREKVLNYRQISALEELVLVAQKTREVTIYRRAEQWEAQVLTRVHDTMALHSIGLELPLSQIYRVFVD